MKKIGELSNDEKQRALDLYRKAIVIDGLNGSPPRYLQKIRAAGVTATNFTSFYNYHTYRYGDLHEVLVCICDWLDMLNEHPDVILLPLTSADIEKAKKEGKIAMILGLQNPKPIEDQRIGLSGVIDYDFRPLRMFHRLGIRILQVACDQRSLVGDGCVERTNAGLTDFGVKLVEEMNRLGMLIDLGHSGKATTLDTVELSKDPVIFSHTNVRSICDNPRNKSDEEIKALAEKRGVMGVTVFGTFVSKKPKPSIEDALDHIDYVVNLVGADYVGIGTDITEGRVPQEMANINRRPDVWGTFPWHMCIEDVSQFPEFAQGLVARGYSDNEILKILGENFMRVFAKVWK